MEAAIIGVFLPAIYGEKVSGIVRLLVALPVKCAGLAITNPVQTSPDDYIASTLVCPHLLQAGSWYTNQRPNGSQLQLLAQRQQRLL